MIALCLPLTWPVVGKVSQSYVGVLTNFNWSLGFCYLFSSGMMHDSDTDFIKGPVGSRFFTLGDLHPGELHQPRHCGAERVGCHAHVEPPRSTGWCRHPWSACRKLLCIDEHSNSPWLHSFFLDTTDTIFCLVLFIVCPRWTLINCNISWNKVLQH